MRFNIWKTRWDFYTGGEGPKSGYVTALTKSDCTLKTAEPIEFRRWIRMMISCPSSNLTFTAVGRVVRCENSLDAAAGAEVTLYRYRVELTYPISTMPRRDPVDPVSALDPDSLNQPLILA